MELNYKVNVWLRDGDRGTSSDAIVTKLTGLNLCKPWEMYSPSDPSDFERCLKLLIAVPELIPQMHEMIDVSPQWKQIITHWDELTQLYYEECKTGSCQKLYDRMKAIQRLRG